MVAIGRLACSAIPCGLCFDHLALATDRQQQKICVSSSPLRVKLIFSLFCFFTLAMSDELAQNEEDAEDYDLESLTHRTRLREDDDDATLVDSQRQGPESVADDHVVFEIGDEDAGSDGEEESNSKRHRLSGENRYIKDSAEREGLIGGGQARTRND